MIHRLPVEIPIIDAHAPRSVFHFHENYMYIRRPFDFAGSKTVFLQRFDLLLYFISLVVT